MDVIETKPEEKSWRKRLKKFRPKNQPLGRNVAVMVPWTEYSERKEWEPMTAARCLFWLGEFALPFGLDDADQFWFVGDDAESVDQEEDREKVLHPRLTPGLRASLEVRRQEITDLLVEREYSR